MSDTTETLSHIAKPCDDRCRWWQKTLAAEAVIALDPASIEDANSIPGTYLRKGADLELNEWTVLFDGEQVHHKKPRGWTWTMGIVLRVDGALKVEWIRANVSKHKAVIKAAGAAHLLGGSGDVASMVRVARWILEADTTEARMERIAAITA